MDRKIPTLDAVCQKAAKLPCSPTLLPRLTVAIQKGNSSSEELEHLILLDPGLASATLRLANSAFFGAGHEIETVSEAIFRLGFREIYRLAATTLSQRWLSQPVEGYGWEAGDFCRHSLCVAVAAERLAEEHGKVDPEVAYTAGLIMDLGKLALAHSCAEFFVDIREHQNANHCPWWKSEEAVLGYHQSQIGANLLQRWAFPAALTAVAHYADRPSEGPPEHISLLANMHAAKFVATSIGPGVAEDGFLMELDSDLLVAHGFTAESLIAAQPDILEAVTRLLRENITHGPVTF